MGPGDGAAHGGRRADRRLRHGRLQDARHGARGGARAARAGRPLRLGSRGRWAVRAGPAGAARVLLRRIAYRGAVPLRARPWMLALVLYGVLALVVASPGLVPGRTMSSSDALWASAPWTSLRPPGVRAFGSNRELGDQVRAFQPFLQHTPRDAPAHPAVEPGDQRRPPLPRQRPVGGLLAVQPSRLRPALLVVAGGHRGAEAPRRRARRLRAGPGARDAVRAAPCWPGWCTASASGWSPGCRGRRRAPGRSCPGCGSWPTGSCGGRPRSPSPGSRRRSGSSSSAATPSRASTSSRRPAASSRCACVVLRPPAARRLRWAARRVAAFAAAGALGGALAALTLLPLVELIAHSGDVSARSSLGGAHTPGATCSGSSCTTGGAGRRARRSSSGACWPGTRTYVGALPLMLAGASLVRPRAGARRRRRHRRRGAGHQRRGPAALRARQRAARLRRVAERPARRRLRPVHGPAGRLGARRPHPARRWTARGGGLVAGVAIAVVLAPVVWVLAIGDRPPLSLLGDGLRVAWGFAEPPAPGVAAGSFARVAAIVHWQALLEWLVLAGAALALLALRLAGRLGPTAFASAAVALVARRPAQGRDRPEPGHPGCARRAAGHAGAARPAGRAAPTASPASDRRRRSPAGDPSRRTSPCATACRTPADTTSRSKTGTFASGAARSLQAARCCSARPAPRRRRRRSGCSAC